MNKIIIFALLFSVVLGGAVFTMMQSIPQENKECVSKIVTQEVNPFDFSLKDVNGVIIPPHTKISYRSVC